MVIHRYDILVVGGGPAGASAASAAASRGMRVLVVDKRTVPGRPVQCAEYIPAQLARDIAIPKEAISQVIRFMKTTLPDGTISKIRAPGLMIHRERFDTFLMDEAVNKGAHLLTGVRAESLHSNLVRLRTREGREEYVHAEVVIGADGPRSLVGQWIDETVSDFVYAMQVRVRLARPMDATEVYFDRKFYGGYGWLFPKNGEGNVGVGIKPHDLSGWPLSKALESLVNDLESKGKIMRPYHALAGGLIPVKPVGQIVKGRFALVGDAAGLAHPITGAGIAAAVISGRMAGSWASETVRNDDLSILNQYTKELAGYLGRALGHGRKRRCFMEDKWMELDTIARFCWPGFKEYHAN
ncbi:geranylgeranyl reductase [Desulfoluna limicola]|uniref:Geranylgeranyl reductase n=1 Tax=Desulfoluna limicola TaxID=2810562 RepID=A0ABM7PEP6_9BACT|nr:NAD(P)/FAD-dependent oxidoreductase [Desulfoluna limicola]BCS95765.1 geranylgeranyl reductase [Desulfoluna limicola]